MTTSFRDGMEKRKTSQKQSPQPFMQRFSFKSIIKLLNLIKIVCILIFVQIGFAGYGILVKGFAQDLDVNPLLFSMLRDLVCAPMLYILAVVFEGPQRVLPEPEHLVLFLILGFTGVFGNQLLFILGLYFTSPSIASIFQPSIPVITLILGLVFRIERFHCTFGWFKLVGVFGVFVGAIMIIVFQAKGGDSMVSKYIGFGCLVANCTSMAVYILLQKKFLFSKEKPLYPPIHSTAFSYLFGIVFMVGSSVISFLFIDPNMFKSLTFQVFIPLMYSAVVQSAICYSLISYANTQVPSSIVTVFWPAQTVSTIIMSAIFFNESLVWNDYVGTVLICLGLIIVCTMKYLEDTISPKKRKRNPLGSLSHPDSQNHTEYEEAQEIGLTETESNTEDNSDDYISLDDNDGLDDTLRLSPALPSLNF